MTEPTEPVPAEVQAAPMIGELVACAACAERPEAVEPIEVGWYAYSGGTQTMVFHLRETGQWSVHVDNGSAADCGWSYIEQALGVWDLVPLAPLTTTQRDGLAARIEALVAYYETDAIADVGGDGAEGAALLLGVATALRAALDATTDRAQDAAVATALSTTEGNH